MTLLTENMTAGSGDGISIFLSYTRDDLVRAKQVISALELQGFQVWWDGLLEGGSAFARTTEAALENANAVVVLWSARAVQSHWVRDEATRGRDRGCLIPVSIDGSAPPLGFRQIQYVDITKWNGKQGAPEINALISAIRQTVAVPGAQLPYSGRGSTPKSGVQRRTVIAMGSSLLAVTGGVLAWRNGWIGGGAVSRNSVAVLPFENLSGDPAQQYFSDGLSEELRASLSLNTLIEVAAQTSSNSFRGTNLEAKSIAKKLSVAYILDGSVRKAADVFRISAQLIDGRTGFEKWAKSFDRKITDIFGVQSEIAAIVSDALAERISADTDRRQRRVGGTENTEAYDAFLKGQALYALAADENSDRSALAHFNTAIGLDPKYAAAFAAKSRALTVIANNYATGDQLGVYYQQSIDAAKQAIVASPTMAEGYAALGFVLFNGRLDAKAAKAPYQKSFELGFGNADILSSYANFAARTGLFDDARTAIARAQRLDPLNPLVFRNAGIVEYCARDFDAALSQLRTALSLNPKGSGIYFVMGDIQMLLGAPEKALVFYNREPGDLARLKGLAIAQTRLNNVAEGQAAMAKMISDFGDNSLYQQAEVLSQWGKKSDALSALERAMEVGDSGLVFSRNDPLLDPLRKDPRFRAIQERIGFV